ncbi:MAG: hypothetical protein IJW03_05615 [Clostridia bacterium]|nr:hypothetical protein [Clostridia bacterium]
MKSRLTRICAALCLVTTAFFATAVRSGANSAQSYWSGTSSAGVTVNGGSCPITVTHETLTFDISEFPASYYGSVEELEGYSASVSAKYEFYNPSDMTVTANLVFPFGSIPDYVNLYTENGRTPSMPTDKYGVQVNGESVECGVRHTYSDFYYGFDIYEDIPKLHDGFKSNEFFTHDTPIYRYSYSFDIETNKRGSSVAAFTFNLDSSKTKVFAFGDTHGYEELENGTQVILWAEKESTADLYFIGEAPSVEPSWKFYSDGRCETEIKGTATRLDKPNEFTRFYDFAMQKYDESYGVSESDWYNAVLDAMTYYDNENGVYLADYIFDSEHFLPSLLNWYEYEITLGPGESLTNTVTAPLYPSIDGDYEPPVYQYIYLLSPAKSWASFGTLDIYINTPYYITRSSLEGFEKSENGYEAHLSSLPDSELDFSLSASENPERTVTPYTVLGIILIVIAVILAPITLICILVTWIIGLVDNSKN